VLSLVFQCLIAMIWLVPESHIYHASTVSRLRKNGVTHRKSHRSPKSSVVPTGAVLWPAVWASVVNGVRVRQSCSVTLPWVGTCLYIRFRTSILSSHPVLFQSRRSRRPFPRFHPDVRVLFESGLACKSLTTIGSCCSSWRSHSLWSLASTLAVGLCWSGVSFPCDLDHAMV